MSNKTENAEKQQFDFEAALEQLEELVNSMEEGDLSLEEERLDEARRFYRRASKLGPDLAETRAARGLWALESGNEKAARKWLRRSRALDPDESRTQELASRLSQYHEGTE